MSLTLSDVYAFETMLAVFQKFATPPEFLGVRYFPEELIDGENAVWEEVRYNRGQGYYVDKDAPAKRVRPTSRKVKSATLARIAMEKALPQSYLLYERSPGSFDRSIIEEKVTREQRDLWNRVLRAREIAAWQVLFEHKFTASYEGTNIEVTFDVDATHKPVVAKSWADPTADIISDIETYKEVVSKDADEDPVLMVVPPVVMRYMIKNQSVRDLMGEELKDQIRLTGRIQRLLELDIEVYGKGYVPDGGVWTPYVPQNKILISTTPGSFGNFLLGPELLKLNDEDVRVVRGRWSYAKVVDNPTRIMLYAGEHHLPVIKQPDNLLTATVVL